METYLVLENGKIFKGKGVGVKKDVICEIVFNTSMTGYLEILTDPSYAEKGVVMTYPLIGNYGIAKEDKESQNVWVKALIVHRLSKIDSNFRSEETLEKFLIENDTTGIEGIDTRELTKTLRNNGTMRGMITKDISNIDEVINKIKEYKHENLVEKVTRKEKEVFGNGKYKIALIDYGTKMSVIRDLVNKNCTITAYPADVDVEEILNSDFDGIILSNGPGDPKECNLESVKKLYEAEIPVLGICLGHQLLALATNANTKKLKYGHRGANHPVKDLKTDRVYITSQNHGYVVEDESLDKNKVEPYFININDKTIEGLRYKGKNIITVQFQPVVCAGPNNTEYVFDEFIQMLGGK